MNRRHFARIALSISGGLVLPFLPGTMRTARADDVSDALTSIMKAREGLMTLVGPFVQERTIGLLATVVTSNGEMTMVRPDRLRWELFPPDAVTYWVGPEGFSFATPRGTSKVGKAAAGRFGAVLTDLMILLGGDLQKLRMRYDLSVPKKENGVTLRALPLADDVRKHVKSIEMSTGPKLWDITHVNIEEQSGDLSVIRFGTLVRDVAVDSAKMAPPKSA